MIRGALPLAALLAAMLLAAPARALDGEPEDVRRPLSRDVTIDWTSLSLEVTSSATGHGVGATHKVLEHEARAAIGPDVGWGAQRVRVAGDTTVGDLLGEPDLGDALKAREERWVVTEARYYTSGKVELVGELSLQELLKPWAIRNAPVAPQAGRPTRYTGLVVDARGTGAEPAFSPRLLAEDGEVLWSGRLWDDVALFQAPVVYVSDPAHPAAARAGPQPLVVRAVGARGPDLVVPEDDRVRYRTALAGSRVPGEGTVVVVIDP